MSENTIEQYATVAYVHKRKYYSYYLVSNGMAECDVS